MEQSQINRRIFHPLILTYLFMTGTVMVTQKLRITPRMKIWVQEAHKPLKEKLKSKERATLVEC
jgi:hypothetical protein